MRFYLGKKDLLLIANPLGMIMQGIGVVVLIPLIVALLYNEHEQLSLLVFGLFSIGLGFILRRLPADYNQIGRAHV
jgi:trk system potassium uptake protein TrkH